MKAALTLIPIFLFSLLVISCERESLELDEELTEETSEFEEEESDYLWDENDVIYITVSDNSISSAEGVTISGDTITITSAGTYSFSGSLSDGQIIVNVAEEELVRLLFNGINIHCSSNAPLYVMEAGKVVMNLVEGTENYFSDGTSYSGFEDPNACIYSKSDLTIFGEGELHVTANYNDGTITVNMSGYDVDAMDSNGDITINGGIIKLFIPTNSPASALDANGTISISEEAEVYENGEVYSTSGSGFGGGH